MASDFQAITYIEAVPGTKAAGGVVRWSRVVPLMLLVPIVFAFGTPVLAFALLLAVLAAPVLVAAMAVMAAKHDRAA